VLSATGLPFLGLTAGTDSAWSARFWKRACPRHYEPAWCSSVRVVGNRLEVTRHPRLHVGPRAGEEQERTIGVWGTKGHATINSLRVAIVGLGSVGNLICVALAMQGVEELILIDF